MARYMILVVVAMLHATASVEAAPILFQAHLSGPAEDPPNASPATGFVEAEFDLTTHTLRIEASFAGLLANTTAAHIHAPTPLPFTGVASVATQVPSLALFPLGVTNGTFVQLLPTDEASTYRPGFITANGGTVADAEAALFNFMVQGRSYFNIHTLQFPGGEIRGFLTVVPEPGTLTIFGLSGACAVLARRRRPEQQAAR